MKGQLIRELAFFVVIASFFRTRQREGAESFGVGLHRILNEIQGTR